MACADLIGRYRFPKAMHGGDEARTLRDAEARFLREARNRGFDRSSFATTMPPSSPARTRAMSASRMVRLAFDPLTSISGSANSTTNLSASAYRSIACRYTSGDRSSCRSPFRLTGM